MSLDERYFTPISLEVNFVDNDTGEPLSGGFAEFYKDDNRIVAKPVYQLTGSPPNYTYTPLGNPVFMNSVGKFIPTVGSTTPIAIYAYPFDEDGNVENYYVVIKSSDGTVQETREAWPNLTDASDPTKTENSISNEISNPQFVQTSFDQDNGFFISISGAVTDEVYDIGPDWDLIVSTSGSATIDINRLSIAGSLNVPTNPPYTLDILTSGANIFRLRLRQRFGNNPDIWANGFIAGHFVTSSKDGLAHDIEVLYSPSVAPSPTIIVSGSTGVSGYQSHKNTVELDAGTNTDTSLVGYIDIIVELPVVGHFDITSIQVVGLSVDDQNVQYDQETVNRQEDHLFHYYRPLLQNKQIDGYLTGWLFRNNPAQWGEAITMGVIGSQKSKYLWDQTIGYQEIDNSFLAYRDSFGGLALTTSQATKLAIIQYIDTDNVRGLLSNPCSVYAKMYRGASTSDTVCTISLWYTKDVSLPDVSSGQNDSLVLTLDANGKPSTFNGSWFEIPMSPIGDTSMNIDSSDVLSQNERYFDGFELGDSSEAAAATFGAIVVGFESITSSSEIFITDVSCVPGGIAAPSPAKTKGQVLSECEYFYEKSYERDVYPGTVVATNQYVNALTAGPNRAGENGNYRIKAKTFSIIHKNEKRVAPSTTIYSSITGSSNSVNWIYNDGGSGLGPGDIIVTSYWTLTTFTNVSNLTASSSMTTIVQIPGNFPGWGDAYIRYHYVADSRLGII